MTENKEKILEMLSQNKITVEEAAKLLELVDKPETNREEYGKSEFRSKQKPKYLRVVLNPGKEGKFENDVERVNIRIPLALVRAGVKFTSLMPDDVAKKIDTTLNEKGIDFNLRNLKEEDIERIIDALSDLEVDIEAGKAKVNIYTE